jgi:S1-C subfamily serine protease
LLPVRPFEGAAQELTSNVANRVKSGTAFFVSADGFLVTSAHVVAGCPEISLWPTDGPERTARVVAADAALDLALLSARGEVLRYAAEPRRDHARYPGEPVLTIGFGSLPSRPRQPKVTSGKLVGDVADAAGNRILLIRAKLLEGNSGGPVIDAAGSLVGVVRGRDAQQPELGVAVPSDAVGWFLSSNQIAPAANGPERNQPINSVDLLKQMSVLVQCTPGHRRAATRTYHGPRG